ncbi:MAG: hypothetical protein M1814_001063 [Vezdaea aestivalis]|nr:MAG: hypothetical protein M1814_001063 [Vezdaea aestivalis]
MESNTLRSPRFVTFRLERFSHATLRSKDDKNTPYQHVTSQGDLFLVFDIVYFKPPDHGPRQEHQIVKVLHGSDRLEVLDLHEKVEGALQARNGIPFEESDPQSLSIVALMASPKLAIRYNTNDGKVRRVQFCFLNHEDFSASLVLLKAVGWPTTAAARPKSRQGVLQSRAGNTTTSITSERIDSPISAMDPVTPILRIKSALRNRSRGSQQLNSQPSSNSSHLNVDDTRTFTFRNRLSGGQPYFDAETGGPPFSSNLPDLQSKTDRINPNMRPDDKFRFPVNENVGQVDPSLKRVVDRTFLSGLSPLPQPTFVNPGGSQTPIADRRGPILDGLYLSGNDHTGPETQGHLFGAGSQVEASQSQRYPIPPAAVQARGTPTSGAMSQRLHNPAVADPDIDLAAYAALPVEQRAESLDKWICAMLEDDNFLTLLEDMQNSWRRIGFSYQ